LVHPASISSMPERGARLARCPKCGALTPSDGVKCVHCGTAFGRGAEAPPPQAPSIPRVSQREEIVYRYIVENMGEISLSKASTDLHMTTSEVQASIQRLEDSGMLSRDGSREG
jgi:ribosomal protein L40E